jgi:hypothetical protein
MSISTVDLKESVAVQVAGRVAQVETRDKVRF